MINLEHYDLQSDSINYESKKQFDQFGNNEKPTLKPSIISIIIIIILAIYSMYYYNTDIVKNDNVRRQCYSIATGREQPDGSYKYTVEYQAYTSNPTEQQVKDFGKIENQENVILVHYNPSYPAQCYFSRAYYKEAATIGIIIVIFLISLFTFIVNTYRVIRYKEIERGDISEGKKEFKPLYFITFIVFFTLGIYLFFIRHIIAYGDRYDLWRTCNSVVEATVTTASGSSDDALGDYNVTFETVYPIYNYTVGSQKYTVVARHGTTGRISKTVKLKYNTFNPEEIFEADGHETLIDIVVIIIAIAFEIFAIIEIKSYIIWRRA